MIINSVDESSLITENNKKAILLNCSPELIKKEYGSLKGSYKVSRGYRLLELII